MLYRTYVVLLKEEEEKEVAAERAREAQVAAEEEMDRQRRCVVCDPNLLRELTSAIAPRQLGPCGSTFPFT